MLIANQENTISNAHSETVRSAVQLESVQATGVYQALDKKLQKKSLRRRLVRYGLVGFNALLVVGIAGVIVVGQSTSGRGSAGIVSSVQAADKVTNPLDQVSSADIAVNIARMSDLSEATKVVNQADSVSAEMTQTPASTSIVAKPQIVATALKSKKDIQTYVTVPGDTLASVATKFGVTSDSIRWSNNLNTNTVPAGQALTIPPVNGIVYVVKAGDTPESLAGKYKSTAEGIIAYNDAEIGGLKVGEKIIIPNGSQPAPVVNTRAAVSSYAWGSAPIYGFNGYTYGYCTWYVAGKIAVPANWGNANTWDNRAPSSGWIVSSIPRVGAIGQTNRGSEGHVAIVEAVSPDGTMIKYSDMNGLAGWGRVGYSDWTTTAKFENYIYQ